MIYDLRFKNKKAFTLIELMVAVVIVVMAAGGGLIYLNKTITNQKLLTATSGVVAHIKLAENYAKTRQMPAGSTGRLNYVTVTVTSNRITAYVNSDVGSSYFSYPVENGIILDTSITADKIYFWEGGKLASSTSGTLYDPDSVVSIYVGISGDNPGAKRIAINALGSVFDAGAVEYVFGPTSTPVPSPTPTCRPNNFSCTNNSQCCSRYCLNSRCQGSVAE